MLAVICQAGAEHLQDGGLAINYRELPNAVEDRILPHFGVRPIAAERPAMAAAARQDAKSPSFAFADDQAGKQRDATPSLRAVAENRLGATYRRLESLNSAPSGAG